MTKTSKTPKVFGGIQRVDSPRDLVVRVKAIDIRGAVCRDHQKCVVAKAILRQQGASAKWVDVGNSVVLIGRTRKRADRYFITGIAKEQVRFFDENEGRAAPCEVHLKSPISNKYRSGQARPLGSRSHGGGVDKRKGRKRGKNINKPTR